MKEGYKEIKEERKKINEENKKIKLIIKETDEGIKDLKKSTNIMFEKIINQK